MATGMASASEHEPHGTHQTKKATASGATTLPGDPTKGATLFAQNCATCHGANLEGGIGAVLNPIDKLPGISNPLDPTFLIDVITNGRVSPFCPDSQWASACSDVPFCGILVCQWANRVTFLEALVSAPTFKVA